MECSHHATQWFSVTDNGKTYYVVRCAVCSRIGLLGHRSDSALQWAQPMPSAPAQFWKLFQTPMLRPGWFEVGATFWFKDLAAVQPKQGWWMVYVPPGSATPVAFERFEDAVTKAEELVALRITETRCKICDKQWAELLGDVSPTDGHVHDFPYPGQQP